MNLNEQIAGGDIIIDDLEGSDAPVAAAPAKSARLPQMMRRIPVTLTLEVAGEPLVIKVNGAAIGRAEVVVAGEQYGLKVIDLDGLNLDLIAP